MLRFSCRLMIGSSDEPNHPLLPFTLSSERRHNKLCFFVDLSLETPPKAGAYWKTLFISGTACQSNDTSLQFQSMSSQQMVDDRADRSSVIEDCSPRNMWAFYAKMDINYFSLAGFQKFCK